MPGINVGDVVMNFTANTQELEKIWNEAPVKSQQSAQKMVDAVEGAFGTMDAAVREHYERISTEGSSAAQRLKQAFDSLGKTSQQQFQETMAAAQGAYRTITESGVASSTQLAAAALRLAETEVTARKAMGDSIPLALENRVETLRAKYAELTGTLDLYVAEQVKANDVGKAGGAASGGSGSSMLATLGLGGGIAGAAAIGGAAAVSAVSSALRDGTQAALSFGEAFAQVTSIIDTKTPEGTQDVAMLKAQLMELPPTLGTITNLTRAAYEALSSNVPAAEVAELTKSVATFGVAAKTDLFTSMDLMTTVLNAYGLQVKQADSVTSALFKTIELGKIEGPELASNLGRVIPIASALHVNLNELLAALSAMTNGGLSLDESVTALRGTLNSLASPSAEAKKEANALHLSLSDIREEITTKGLSVALSDLANKTKGNSTAQLELIGNIRAATGFLALTGAQSSFYAKSLTEITQASKDANEAQEAMDKIMASQQGRLTTLSNTISNDFVKAWEELTPVINSFGTSLDVIVVKSGLAKGAIFAIVTALVVLSVSMSTAAVAIGAVESALLGIGIGFGKVLSILPMGTEATKNLANTMGDLHRALDASNKGVEDNAKAIQASLKAYADMQNGVSSTTAAHDAYAVAAKKKADADQAGAAAAKAASDAAAIAAQKIADQKAAAELAAAAMKKYADAHGVTMLGELEKNVAEAKQFYAVMVATNQPMGVQLQAAENLNKAQQALNGTLKDTRTLGQAIKEAFSGKNQQMKVDPVEIPVELKMDENTGNLVKQENIVVDEAVEKWKALLQAEQDLGIKGSATLAKQVIEIEQYMETLKRSGASADTLAQAQLKLDAANRELNDSFNPMAQELARIASAEQLLGIEGSRALKQHSEAGKLAMEELRAAYDKGLIGPQELAKAELVELEQRMALLLQYNKPIPESMVTQYSRLTAAINTDARALQNHLNVSQRWYAFWHGPMPSTANTMKELGDLGKTAFMDLAEGTGAAVQAAVLGQKGFGDAMKEMAASTLASIASQSTIKALYNLAEGFAALANPFTSYLAPGYFKASAEYAAVAAVAGVTASALSGGFSGGSSSGSSTGTDSSVSISGAQATTPVAVSTVNVQRFGAGGLVSKPTLAVIGDSRKSASTPAREGIIPLEDPEAMSTIGSAIAGSMKGSGDTHIWNIKGLVSADTMGDIMDQMNGMVQKGKRLHATSASRVIKKS